MNDYFPEIPPQPDKVRYTHYPAEGVSCEDNDILLAQWAAKSFIKTKKRVDEAQESAEKLWKMLAQAGTELRAARLAGKGMDSILKIESELRESKDSWEALLKDALKDLESCQEDIEPFWRDGTLAKTEFADLDPEILDFGDVEPPSPLVSRVTYERDVSEARRTAEGLRDGVWGSLSPDGPPISQRKLPWE